MWGWVTVNFPYEPLPGLVLTFLLPFTLVYILVWLGRWVGWYAEVGEIRSRLGLAPGPSFLKWRETLPHMAYALVLCLAVPLALRAADAVDGPLLSVFYAGVLLPVGAFITGSSLGKRRGFCPLYPLMCGVGILMFIPMARLFSNMDDRAMVPTAFVSALLGNLLGVARRRRRDRMAARPAGEGCLAGAETYETEREKPVDAAHRTASSDGHTVLQFRAAAGFERVSIPLLCRYHRLWFAGDRHWLADREDGWSGTPTGEK